MPVLPLVNPGSDHRNVENREQSQPKLSLQLLGPSILVYRHREPEYKILKSASTRTINVFNKLFINKNKCTRHLGTPALDTRN